MDEDDFEFGYEHRPDDDKPDFDGAIEEQDVEIELDELLNDNYNCDDRDENYGQAIDDAHKVIDSLEPISEP
ncbi:hypothetical protein HNP48_001547 [Acidovorax soli]|uniref:Uncharacterized protein n=1 Tax=Acidovorax soli TaxID=592050 RepID=A0A7X0U8E4_9BURK|nr:hypothetical protein [Acidovorax soli]MBB6558883.1 hypothetical protein [Acidovorax soli]